MSEFNIEIELEPIEYDVILSCPSITVGVSQSDLEAGLDLKMDKNPSEVFEDTLNDTSWFQAWKIPPLPSKPILIKITWANIKSTLKTYFDGIYAIATQLKDVAWTGKHNDTIDRDAANAHPATAITGLTAALNTILTITEVPVTIAVADWEGGTSVTKTVTGVTTDSTQHFEMSKADSDRVADFGVWATAQAADSLTFVADETPTNDITLTVLILK